MEKLSIGPYIIASSIIWGLVAIGCAYKLSGTGAYEEIGMILIGGATAHLLFLWVPLGNQIRKIKGEESELE
jgi:hypothetical protein